MIQPIVKSPLFLARPSKDAEPGDEQVAQDLLDTLAAHSHECVGLAANMIGVQKRVIVFDDNGTPRAMFNPELIGSSGSYETEESCLSLKGSRATTRWERVKVRYQDERFEERVEEFSGWTAQIIQHEIDHCNGVVI